MENSKRPRVLLFNLVHKQCNSLVKRWLHCLTSESKERFLVKNVLVFASVRAQIQFFLLKKYKKKNTKKIRICPVPLSSIFIWYLRQSSVLVKLHAFSIFF